MNHPDWMRAKAAFQAIWGYTEFRPPQADVIQSLLAGQDALIVMPTGGGKSICFQLPALLQTGVTLVISPLIALMENQVQDLRQRKLPAALLHNEVNATQRRQTLHRLEHQDLRLLYLSPETLLSPAVWACLCQPHLRINGLILDEAHCLVQWGETFRPAYRRLGAVRPALLPHQPDQAPLSIAAFTATADPSAQATIRSVLQLENPTLVQINPYRHNLNLHVKIAWSPHDRRQQLLTVIHAHPGKSGLVYVRTRRDAEALADWMTTQQLKAVAYHAGLGSADRRTIEQTWLQGTVPFVICTSAFGMGINKPDLRWIVHFHPPLSLSEYVQEIGRAGRDGDSAIALLLRSEPTGWLDPSDRQRVQYFEQQLSRQKQTAQALVKQLPTQGNIDQITRQFPGAALALAWLQATGQLEWKDPFYYQLHPVPTPLPTADNDRAALQQMQRYLNTRHCRWQFLLHAFDPAQSLSTRQCGHCDNCRKPL
jgi:ATP-dependent DNA helicase RecQ